jgi:uncharacterized protein (DUF433 family)
LIITGRWLVFRDRKEAWQGLTGRLPFGRRNSGKVSSAPLLKSTRLPVEAITGNYDAFRSEALSPDEAIAETLDCYPEAGVGAIRAILRYRAERQLQTQP